MLGWLMSKFQSPVASSRFPAAGQDGCQLIQISSENRNALLKDAIHKLASQENRNKAILKSLRRLNPGLWEDFEMKKAAIERLSLKFITSSRSAIISDMTKPVTSYLAVSYCWHDSTWKSAETVDTGLPFSITMFATVFKLRKSEDVAIWVDQLCIEQTDEDEKAVSVAAMDMIYSSASQVVILLEDVVLSPDEVSALNHHIAIVNETCDIRNWILSDEETKTITQAYHKIVAARWFTRAWCAHEFRLSNRWKRDYRPAATTFVAYCRDAGAFQPFCISSEHLSNCGLHIVRQIMRPGYFEPTDSKAMRQLLSFQRASNLMGSVQKTGDQYAGSYLDAFNNLHSFGCRDMRDLISIALNTCEVGLIFRGSVNSKTECLWIGAALSLVIGDLASLSTHGLKIQMNLNGQSNSSWVQDEVDATGRLLLCEDIRVGRASPSGIQVDLLVLSGQLRSFNFRSLVRVRQFVRSCAQSPVTFPEGTVSYVAGPIDRGQTVGAASVIDCALACGVEWMVKAWEVYGSLVERDSIAGQSPITTERKDYIWSKIIEPKSGLLGEDYQDRNQRTYMDANKEAITSLLSTIVDRDCLSIPGIAIRIQTSADGGQALTMAKDVRGGGTSLVDGKFILAVPVALADKQYQRLSRLWVLEEVSLQSERAPTDNCTPEQTIIRTEGRSYPQSLIDDYEIVPKVSAKQLSTCEKAETHALLRPRKYLRLVDKFPLVGCPTIEADGDVVTLRMAQNVFGL